MMYNVSAVYRMSSFSPAQPMVNICISSREDKRRGEEEEYIYVVRSPAQVIAGLSLLSAMYLYIPALFTSPALSCSSDCLFMWLSHLFIIIIYFFSSFL